MKHDISRFLSLAKQVLLHVKVKYPNDKCTNHGIRLSLGQCLNIRSFHMQSLSPVKIYNCITCFSRKLIKEVPHVFNTLILNGTNHFYHKLGKMFH